MQKPTLAAYTLSQFTYYLEILYKMYRYSLYIKRKIETKLNFMQYLHKIKHKIMKKNETKFACRWTRYRYSLYNIYAYTCSHCSDSHMVIISTRYYNRSSQTRTQIAFCIFNAYEFFDFDIIYKLSYIGKK